MNFLLLEKEEKKFTVPADKKGESAKHFGNGAVQRADLARCRVSVEFRHLNIHQHQIELIRRCGAERLNGNIAVVCKADGKSGVRKELHRDFLYHMADVDRHAKSRTLNAADRRSLLACKRFKEVLLEFPAYADAVVADVEFVERIPFFIVRFLNNTDNDGAAVLCEFRGIAQQIQQNLVQAEKGAGRRWKSCSGIPAPGPAD